MSNLKKIYTDNLVKVFSKTFEHNEECTTDNQYRLLTEELYNKLYELELDECYGITEESIGNYHFFSWDDQYISDEEILSCVLVKTKDNNVEYSITVKNILYTDINILNIFNVDGIEGLKDHLFDNVMLNIDSEESFMKKDLSDIYTLSKLMELTEKAK